jgi:Shedu protein SduA, C-terminal
LRYYYKLDDLSEKVSLKRLREIQESRAESLGSQLASLLHTSIGYHWTRRDTFGYIFTDFEYEQEGHQRLIGKGEIDLFKRLKDDYYCVVLSKSMTRNFQVFQMGLRKCVRINLDYFKDFLSVIRDRGKTVRLFLYKFDKPEDETLIRSWLKNYDGFEEVQREAISDVDSFRGMAEKLNIRDPRDLESLVAFARQVQSRAWTKLEPYEDKLTRFRTMVENNVNESDLHNFLFDNLWMIDVQYQFYQKKLKKEPVDVGEIDISLYQDAIGIERVAIIELKKAGKEVITDTYRGSNKPAIMAEFGRALSQTIHYVETSRTRTRVIEGILIIGRKREVKDWFMEKFNEYLHGIKVLTYDDIIENAMNVLKLLRDMELEKTSYTLPEVETPEQLPESPQSSQLPSVESTSEQEPSSVPKSQVP